MTNPLDYAKRESFSQATEISIEDVSVVSATFFETILKKFFKDAKAGPPGVEDVDITSVADIISNTYSPTAAPPKSAPPTSRTKTPPRSSN
jgi:hypothetical protein